MSSVRYARAVGGIGVMVSLALALVLIAAPVTFAAAVLASEEPWRVPALWCISLWILGVACRAAQRRDTGENANFKVPHW